MTPEQKAQNGKQGIVWEAALNIIEVDLLHSNTQKQALDQHYHPPTLDNGGAEIIPGNRFGVKKMKNKK